LMIIACMHSVEWHKRAAHIHDFGSSFSFMRPVGQAVYYSTDI
jgi:hypothetical protein